MGTFRGLGNETEALGGTKEVSWGCHRGLEGVMRAPWRCNGMSWE